MEHETGGCLKLKMDSGLRGFGFGFDGNLH
jgi:hypothetical protein